MSFQSCLFYCLIIKIVNNIMPPVIFNKLINHCRFKNINGLICKPINVNESKNEIIIQVINPNNNNNWQETWNNLNAVVNAFQIGEYLFID